MTPEEERRKEISKYLYLTWFLRTQIAGREVEKWCKERLRQEKIRPEECEEEMKMKERDKESKVEVLLMREGLGSEIASILYR